MTRLKEDLVATVARVRDDMGITGRLEAEVVSADDGAVYFLLRRAPCNS